MKLALASIENLPDIMKIIDDAQKYLAAQGIDQWQDGYPSENQIKLDIENQVSYVITNVLGNIMAIVMFTTKPETTYETINGNWLTPQDEKYGVIHRLAIGKNYRNTGIAKFVFSEFEDELQKRDIKSMRIDTHRDNTGMLHLLTQNGYSHCGIINTTNGAERLAFEKLF